MLRWWRHWPTWAGYAAAVWSAVYGALGVFWALGGGGFPFAPVAGDRASGSILEGSRAGVVAPVMAVAGLVGAVVAVAMARGWGRGRARTVMLVFGWTMAATLALAIPDYTLLMLVAFAPLLLVFAFTGVPGPQDGIGDILYWHRVNLIILFLGGLLWALAALAYHRPRWTTPEAARRWGRWAVYVACAAPVPYEITRIAWYFGVPLGIPEDFLLMMRQTPGMLEVGLGGAIGSIGGCVLTHGLVSRWGEVYPRWVWFRAGERVPPALAVVPASVVAVVLVPAGLMNVRLGVDPASWGVNVPGMLWTVWGLALGVAAWAYALRRGWRSVTTVPRMSQVGPSA
ncbi:NYN domain-containing protein [Herbidospora sp. NEAU-GS84]|uniref:NYN domain-containing protein n=1 Tax=Herbidospora solisilvae TaxID=2696284 RepID=A0A7C9J2D1_9ACTN|nr:NYN domain-containing protein [Herbidospora solisilvae]NAS22642.1 NYN domain-containing protein [Herbidospora solisilvae]